MTEHTPEKPDTAHTLNVEEGYLSMSLSADVSCELQFEVWPGDQEIRCAIQFNPLEGEETIIGKVCARLIDRELAYTFGWTDKEIFDDTGANWEVYEEVYRCKPRIPRSARTALMVKGVESNANILVIDTVDILPQYRGLNFSLIALRSLIHHFRLKAGLVVLLLLPGQFLRPDQVEHEDDEDPGWLPRMGLESFPTDLLESQTRLQRHFGKLGFAALPKTRFMIADPLRDLPTDRREPAGCGDPGRRPRAEPQPALMVAKPSCSGSSPSSHWLRWDHRSARAARLYRSSISLRTLASAES